MILGLTMHIPSTNTSATSGIVRKKTLALTAIGAGLEYYDFSIFAFFAAIIGKLYFSVSSPELAFIAGYAVFAIGTVARLFGGAIFSYLGDKYGRKTTFIYTIFFMAVPSLLISVLPTYQHIGIAAPILLLILRLMQGAATGGEVPTAIAFIAEFYPNERKTMACALLLAGIFTGFFLASFIQIILSYLLSAAQLQSWGWRIAYLIGGIFGIIGFIIRRFLQESPAFLTLMKQKKLLSNPLFIALKHYWLNMFAGLLMLAAIVTFTYIFFSFLPNYLINVFYYKNTLVFLANSYGIVISIISIILFGMLSKYVAKQVIMFYGCLLFFLSSYPIFYAFSLSNSIVLFVNFTFVGIFSGMLLAPIYALLADLFPTPVRISGMGISLNLATILFGAFGVEIIVILTRLTQDKLSPAYFVMVCCLLSACGLWLNRTIPKQSDIQASEIS